MNRPAILSAKIEKLAEIISNQETLKGMPKSERPSEASLDQVRQASNESIEEILGDFSAVSDVTEIELPEGRLRG